MVINSFLVPPRSRDPGIPEPEPEPAITGIRIRMTLWKYYPKVIRNKPDDLQLPEPVKPAYEKIETFMFF
jgi:hypothetical protein